MKCWAGWITSWNQYYQEKYQQPQICRWYHSNGRKWRESKSFLMRVKEESEKAGLKLHIQKTKITASSPITSWQIEYEKAAAVTDFLSLGFRITADTDCSLEIQRHLLLGRKDMTHPGNIRKQWRHHFANKDSYSQSCGFSSSHVWMWELDHKEGWALKKWCFWTLVLWRWLLRFSWTARKSNQ